MCSMSSYALDVSSIFARLSMEEERILEATLRTLLPPQQGGAVVKGKCAICGRVAPVQQVVTTGGRHEASWPDLWICEEHKEDWR